MTAKLADLLTLERIERDLYRAPVTADEHRRLYGGQVAAQALAAAGDTVDPDMSTGLAVLHDGPLVPSLSVDHAVWFHRQVRLDEWVLMNVVPHSTAGGRGWYTGTIHAVDGVLGASLAQEALFGRGRT